MRWLLLVSALLAGCSSDEESVAVECGAGTLIEGDTCIPVPRFTCGPGTVDRLGVCEAPPTLQILAPSSVVADGTSQVPIRVVGSGPGGGAKRAGVVLSLGRASAGELPYGSVFLDKVGATTTLIPCATTTPGCVGPVEVRAAWADAPGTIVATTTIDLVGTRGIGSLADCPARENVVVVRRTEYYSDHDDPVDATIVSVPSSAYGEAQVLSLSGTWPIWFGSWGIDRPLVAGVYTEANDQATRGRPTFWMGTGAPSPACPRGFEFQIHELARTHTLVESAAATFRIFCTDDPTRELTGCVRYSR